jgi:3-isopropylmalate dehydrogenase
MIKMKDRKILLLPGDGIGPEVVGEAKKIINWFNKNKSLDFKIEEGLVGGASYDKHKNPITDEVFFKALESEAIILGAVGGPKYDNLEFSKRPERALLKLRKELKLFANLRPAICFEQLVDASSLKPEIISGLDIMIVRELTGGIYFGEPRGIEPIENNERRGVNTHTYTTSEIQRVARVAFELSKKRNNKVTSCEKSNVMEAGVLWREEVQALKDSEKEFKNIQLSHMLADNCAMQLLRNPKQFDVIVTDNLFGDILSDEAAMLTGSLGLLPSASLGAKDKNGKIRSMYEPVHGSAPDIAGKNIANPIATILSLSMALRYSLNLDKEANLLDLAVQNVLDDGLRTKDIMSVGKKEVSTSVMGDAIISKLK